MESGKKRQLSLGVVISYIAIIAQCLSGVIYTPIILHSLGQSQYGVYSLCISFSGYLTIFNAGINAAVVRFYIQTKTRDETKLPSLNGVFVRIFIIFAALSLLIGLVISWKAEWFFGSNIRSQEYVILKKLFVILAFTTCITVINCIFSSLIIANEKFIFAKLVNLIQIVLAPILTIPLLLNGYGSIAIFIIKLILTIAIVIFNAHYCFFKLRTKFEFKRVEQGLLKSILVFAGAITIQSVMDQLNWQIDKFILARTRGTAEISVYSVGSTLNTYYITLSSTMSSVFIAEINRLVALNKNKEVSELFVKTSRIFALMVLLLMSGYCIFGKAFIERWAGKEYSISFYVGLLLMLPVTSSLTMGLGQDIVRAKNLHKKQIFINVMVCICNFIVSIPLAMMYGAIGSALGTFFCEIVICIIIQSIYYNNVANLNMRQYYMEMLHIIPGLVFPAIFGFVINKMRLVKSNYSSIILYALLYCIVYVVSMWIIVMNTTEKNMVRRAIKKLSSKFGRR